MLDVLILDDNQKTREEFGNPIKDELQNRMRDAKKMKDPPRSQYIANMEKIMIDLNERIAGKKTDDERKYLLDLNKDPNFNEAVLKEFVKAIFDTAKKTDTIENEDIYKKLMSQPEYQEYVIRFIKHRKDGLTDTKQKENMEKILAKLV